MGIGDSRIIWAGGFWHHNPALVRALGVSPLIAVSDTLVTAVALGLILLVLLCVSSLVVALTRHLVPVEVRLPCYALVLATLVTLVDLCLQAWAFELRLALGIYLPVLAGSALVVSRAEEFAARNRPLPAVIDAIANGLGVLLVFMVIAVLREALAYGTMLRDVSLVGGHYLGLRQVQLPFVSDGLLLAGLPAGGMIGLGLLAALSNKWERRHLRV